MKVMLNKEIFYKYIGAVGGALFFAAALNIVIVPLNLYNGGFTGIGQLVRAILINYLHVTFPENFDITGTIFFLLNVPLLILAYKELNRDFFVKTIITVTCQSIFLSFIPIPKTPIIKDTLAACVVGGVIMGYAVGITLRLGSSGGGVDILGIYCAKKYPDFSVGKITLLISFFVFSGCAIMFNLETSIYSIILTAISTFVMDKVHDQNIKTSALIFTKKEGIPDSIMHQLNRGVTGWIGSGCYTNEKTYILMTVISKYEVKRLKKIVHEIDSDAFMIFNDDLGVIGNFEKRF